VDMLVDIVSRNGNLLLNFPLPGSGELDPDELRILDGISRWMHVNSEGIYGTRPWKVNGESPTGSEPAPKVISAAFNEQNRKDLTAADIRFTSKGRTIYAFVMGWPEGEAVVKSLGAKSDLNPGKIQKVELLGHKGKLKWTQDEAGLKVLLTGEKPSEHAVTLKLWI
jgi:alpha-L-fucosidase